MSIPVGEARTARQTDANRLDLEVFRVVTALDRFAIGHQDGAVREMALIIDGMRHRIRRQMHPKDREATNG